MEIHVFERRALSILKLFMAFLDYQNCDTKNEFNKNQNEQSVEKSKGWEHASRSKVSG